MRPHWMTDDDLTMLEFLVDTGLAFTPKTLAFNMDSIGYYKAAARLPILEEHNMLEYPEPIDGVKNTGIYRASDTGKRFVAGDITLSELRELDK